MPTSSDYLVVGDPDKQNSWHLPVKENGTVSHRLMGQAWAALHTGFRGNKYAGPNADEALSKLKALYKSENMPIPATEEDLAEIDALDPQTFDQPDVADVHMNAALGAAVPKKKGTLKYLAQAVRAHFARNSVMDQPTFESHYRTAISRTGGLARAGTYTEGSPHLHAETGDDFRLFLPIAFAEPPASIPYLPRPGTYQHPRYGALSITPQRNADFVAKFNQGVYQRQVALDGEHETKMSGAMAWITRLSQNPDGSVDASVDWTDRGRQMLAGNRYKYISPEFYDSWNDPLTGKPITNVAIGGALTTRPFFKESALRPLIASEAGIQVPDEDESPIQEFTMPDPVAPETTPQTPPQAPPQTPPQTPPSDNPKGESQQFAELQAERDALKQMAEAAQQEAKQATERIAALEAENRRKTLTEQAQGWHGEAATHVSFMEALPTDELREQYRQTQDAQATALNEAQKLVFTAAGVSGRESEESPMGQIRAFAEQARKDNPALTDAQAQAQAIQQHPEIYDAYDLEQRQAR